MANSIDRIGRDLGTPFDPNNALEVRDWNEIGRASWWVRVC